MLLADEDLLILSIPAAGPVLIGPAQTEGQVEAGVGEDLPQGSVEQALAAKPVIVITEAVNAVLTRQPDLFGLDLGEAQVIKT